MQEQIPSTIYLLHQAGQALRLRLENEFRGLNITGLQFTILGLLDRYSGLSSAELARRFFVTPQTMNQIVANMLRRGLIERSVSEDNRRILKMRLSPVGRDILQQCTVISAQVEADVLEWMAPAAQEEFRKTLATLLRTLRPTVGYTDPLMMTEVAAASETEASETEGETEGLDQDRPERAAS